MLKTVPFQTTQFYISTQFKCKYGLIVKTFLFQAIQFSQTVLIQTIQFNIIMQLALFNPLIGLYQVPPLRPGVDLGAMTMKACTAFPKAPASLNLTIRLFNVINWTLIRWGSNLSAEVLSVYYTSPADSAR